MRGRWSALLLALALAAGAAHAAEPPLAADLHEQVLALAVTVKDLYGREETRRIPLTSYRPDGDGPFPLAVVSHGRAAGSAARAQQGRQRYEALARRLVGQGYAVLVPTRVGYGPTTDDFDPEAAGLCQQLRPLAAAEAAADQVLAAVAFARSLPWVDSSRWLAIGQSVGGFATLAVVARQPPGLQAAVNFSGGIGGHPEARTGQPCGAAEQQRLWQQLGAGSRLPVLWLYWQNDRYWGPDWPRRWAQAWNDGGGQALFHQLPPSGSDGHAGLHADTASWGPIVDDYLERRGLPVRR